MQNRIRHFFTETAPASRPYFVLRSATTGRPPTEASELGWASTPDVQVPAPDGSDAGIVGIVTAVVAAGGGGLAPLAGGVEAWMAATLAFLITLIVLLVYRQRSLVNIRAAFQSDPLHAVRAARCAVLTARIGQ